MGKRERIKRSPSHSNSKIKLSVKELQEFVAATNVEAVTHDENNSESDFDESRSDEDQVLAFGSIHDSCEIAKGKIKRQGVDDAPVTTPQEVTLVIPNGVVQDHSSAISEGPSKFESFLLDVLKAESPDVSNLRSEIKGNNAQDHHKADGNLAARDKYYLKNSVVNEGHDLSLPHDSLIHEDPSVCGFNAKNAEIRTKLEVIKSRLGSLTAHEPDTKKLFQNFNKGLDDGATRSELDPFEVHDACSKVLARGSVTYAPVGAAPLFGHCALVDHGHKADSPPSLSTQYAGSHIRQSTTPMRACEVDSAFVRHNAVVQAIGATHATRQTDIRQQSQPLLTLDAKAAHAADPPLAHSHCKDSHVQPAYPIGSLSHTQHVAACPISCGTTNFHKLFTSAARPISVSDSLFPVSTQATTQDGPTACAATTPKLPCFQSGSALGQHNVVVGGVHAPASPFVPDTCPHSQSTIESGQRCAHGVGPVTTEAAISSVEPHAGVACAGHPHPLLPGIKDYTYCEQDNGLVMGPSFDPEKGTHAHGTQGSAFAGSVNHVRPPHDRSNEVDLVDGDVNICNFADRGSVSPSLTQALSFGVTNIHHVASSDPKAADFGLIAHEATIKKPFVELFKPVHEQTQSFFASLELEDTKRKVNADHESDTNGQIPLCDASFNLAFVDHGDRKDSLVLPIPRGLTDEGKEEWSTTLVGSFLGKKLPYSLVTNVTDRLWAKEGLVDTLATDSGCFFFSFANEGFRDAVLEGGPWFIAGQPIILRPWKPNCSFAKEEVHSVPIWVNFYGIPLEYWNPKGISFISSFIGKPIRVDRMTASRRRITFARVCIEVSAEYDFIDDFNIEAYDEESGKSILTKISLEYQWTPVRCMNCSLFGHDCAKVENPLPLQNSHNRYKTKKEVGVWQTVTRKAKAKLSTGKHSPTPNRRCTEENNQYGNQSLSPSGSIVDRIIIGPSLTPNRKTDPKETKGPAMNVGNMFSALTPSLCENAQRSAFLEEACSSRDHEREAVDDNVEVDNDLIDEDFDVDFHDCRPSPVFPMSSRQKKKEAKMLFSGSRPKGRHRS